MTLQGSVTHWLGLLKAGNDEAAQRIWDRFFARLVCLAQDQLRGLARGPADEEDVALSAFHRFCQAARRGQFPRLEDRDDLWQLLALLAERKARDLRRREARHKRGDGQVRDEAWLERSAASGGAGHGLAAFAAHEPTPELAAVLAEECRVLLRSLGDDGLRALAVAKMEGYANEELAARLGCSVRTVERKLKLIRTIWGRTADDARDATAD
jgi:DNA-directed RNA polymerase specialized sigma24 family protein